MKIIEKIEIKYFRSFADSPTVIMNLRDINIFSGGNDSGKSNVLRALNLFFNNEIDHGTQFRFDRDFSIFKKNEIETLYKEKKQKIETQNTQSIEIIDNGELGEHYDDAETITTDIIDESSEVGGVQKKQKGIKKTSPFVEIKVFFNLGDDHNKSLPQQFRISKRRTTTKNEVIDSNIETEYKKKHKDEEQKLKKSGDTKSWTNRINSLKRTQTLFLKSIEFFYVPAIKDIFFFRDLYNKLQGKLALQATNKLQEVLQTLQLTLQNETKQLFTKFKNSTGLDASFLLGGEVLDFKKNVEVITDERIYLTSRGDGIQARLIPDILAELSINSMSKYIIRGFEEPENSYEYKNSIKLANEFYDKYSHTIQLFITTHAKEFLAMRDKNPGDQKVSIYRVYKETNGESNVGYYDEKKSKFLNKNNKNIGDIEGLNEDLGIIDQSRLIADLEKQISELPRKENKIKELENQLLETIEELRKKQLDEDYLNKELEKAHQNNKTIFFCENENKENFDLIGLSNIMFVKAYQKQHVLQNCIEKNGSVYGIMDRDFLGDSEVFRIHQNTNCVVLDYYSIENYRYHPDNIESYFLSKGESFNKKEYQTEISKEFKKDWKSASKFNPDKIIHGRQSYKYTIDACQKWGGIKIGGYEIIEMIDLNIDNFESIYVFYPMKDYCGTIKDKINQKIGQNPTIELSKTSWFKNKIKEKLLEAGLSIV